MFIEGKIKTYNIENGFGFIEINENNQDIFFDISEFPNKGITPQVGERLKFRHIEQSGKSTAVNIVRLDLKSKEIDRHTPQSRAYLRSQKISPQQNRANQMNLFNLLIGLIVLVIVVKILSPILGGSSNREILHLDSNVSGAAESVATHHRIN
ncbi:cold shock domain-containing protein [Acinetobacter sp. 194]|uniref:cold-shock protein n=1 Tax=Acinetobacter shaoyimingii TaxID=2715164 RepID=UPI00140B0FDE|nr:cold shock domain-containing protein [Acinetobacter shaoyimingii]NHB57579.1 cold shock domain-containing protein [Acinetobacter shaoyimingii]